MAIPSHGGPFNKTVINLCAGYIPADQTSYVVATVGNARVDTHFRIYYITIADISDCNNPIIISTGQTPYKIMIATSSITADPLYDAIYHTAIQYHAVVLTDQRTYLYDIGI